MNFLTENDSTFRLPLVFDFLFQQDIPYWLKVIYISTGTFPSLTNPKGNLTPVKECASLFSVFMNPKFCINEAQPSTLKKCKTRYAWFGYYLLLLLLNVAIKMHYCTDFISTHTHKIWLAVFNAYHAF